MNGRLCVGLLVVAAVSLVGCTGTDSDQEVRTSSGATSAGGLNTAPESVRIVRGMRVDDAEARLREMMRAASFDPDRPTLIQTWSVFGDFVAEPFDTESDGVLVQGGVYDFDGPERYYFDFVRQVQRHGEDEYVQIHCEFQFAITPELAALGEFNDWWFADEGRDAASFLTEMRARPEFEAVANLEPTAAAIYVEET